jgi:hypothetical protein
MELSVIRAAGVDFTVDSGDNRLPILEESLRAMFPKVNVRRYYEQSE